MRRLYWLSVATVYVLVTVCSKCTMAENSQEYIIKAGSDVLHLTDQADAGFTIKIRDDSPDMLSPRGLGNLFAAAAATTTTVGGRGHEDIRIIETEDSNEVAIMLLVGDPHVEYVAPLFSSNGEMVAVIPEIVVRLRDKDQLEALEAACQQLGHQITRPLEFTDLEFLIHPRAKNADDVFRAVAELSALDIVDWAVPNLAFRLIQCGRLIPDDEYFPNQWHLDETEDFGWPGLDDINAPEAWEITVGDPNIVVALIDNGIDMNHPDLKDNIWVNEHETPDNGLDDDGNGYIDDCRGWDFSRDDNNPHDSSNPHATCCAGLIAARGNNGIGVTGVTWNCKLMPVQMIQEGELIYSYVADERIATGIRWAASHGADIMCIPSGSKSTYKTTYSAIKDVTEPGGIGRGGKGCVVVCAAGNNRGPIIYPAAYDETIAVSYWNRGHYVDNLKTPARGPELDLVAPSCAWGCWEKQWYEDPNIGIWTTAVRNRNTGHWSFPSILTLPETKSKGFCLNLPGKTARLPYGTKPGALAVLMQEQPWRWPRIHHCYLERYMSMTTPRPIPARAFRPFGHLSRNPCHSMNSAIHWKMAHWSIPLTPYKKLSAKPCLGIP